MIEKGTKIYKKSVTRILEIDQEAKQVNFLDTRFYKKGDNYYPSITSVLQFFPKNKFFESWLKDVGHNSDIIVRKAADEGTQVHEAIEAYLQGKQISWLNEFGQANYSLDVWKNILKFDEFWKQVKPILIESEIHLFSDEAKIAGTCDLVLEIEGEKWILDIKTSNSLHTSQDLQIAAYAKMWNESFEEKVTRTGILWLKSAKRGPDKSGKKIQGKGWEVYESNRSIEENWKYFQNILELYHLENPDAKPAFENFPLTIQLEG
jgi:ATP-dependent exoDNAse (exonuclease V) beta subunit